MSSLITTKLIYSNEVTIDDEVRTVDQLTLELQITTDNDWYIPITIDDKHKCVIYFLKQNSERTQSMAESEILTIGVTPTNLEGTYYGYDLFMITPNKIEDQIKIRLESLGVTVLECSYDDGTDTVVADFIGYEDSVIGEKTNFDSEPEESNGLEDKGPVNRSLEPELIEEPKEVKEPEVIEDNKEDEELEIIDDSEDPEEIDDLNK